MGLGVRRIVIHNKAKIASNKTAQDKIKTEWPVAFFLPAKI
jgi:hypothetical protein